MPNTVGSLSTEMVSLKRNGVGGECANTSAHAQKQQADVSTGAFKRLRRDVCVSLFSFGLLFFFHWPCHPKDAVEFTNRKCSTETGGVGDLSKGNVCHFEVSHLIAQQPIVPACARTQCWRATLDGAGISVSIHAHTEASRATANILVVTVRLSGAPSKLGVTLLLLMG